MLQNAINQIDSFNRSTTLPGWCLLAGSAVQRNVFQFSLGNSEYERNKKWGGRHGYNCVCSNTSLHRVAPSKFLQIVRYWVSLWNKIYSFRSPSHRAMFGFQWNFLKSSTRLSLFMSFSYTLKNTSLHKWKL